MKERPIIFNSEMVRAILDGRKTQTRRIIKPQPDEDGLAFDIKKQKRFDTSMREYKCPYGKVGDRLYVRENLLLKREGNTPYFDILYKADNTHGETAIEVHGDVDEWCMSYCDWHTQGKESQSIPSIHMLKELARIFLEITDIRVERVQEINLGMMKAEGLYFDLPMEK